MELLKELGAFGMGIILAIGVGLLFWKADEGLAAQGRNDLSQWLRRRLYLHSMLLDRDPPSLPAVVSAMFKKVFGKKHLSWRCFMMSSLFSVLAVVVLSVVFFQIEGRRGREVMLDWDDVLFLAGAALVLNLIPDYISLLETRIVIRFMCRVNKLPAMFGYLALDALLTFLIFLGLGSLVGVMVVLYIFSDLMAPIRGVEDFVNVHAEVVGSIVSAFTFSGEWRFVAIFLYSTFFTSVWVWLTALGWGATLLLAKSPPLLNFMNRVLPIDTHPMRSIGEVAAVIVCLGYWGLSAATWITSTPEAQAALGN